MRACRFLTSSLLVLAIHLNAQEIVKNPSKPANPKAGRILSLKEELRITDAGGEFFFQYPFNLKVGPDGSLYFRDRDELIRLDGRFLRNYYRKGQGPGELNNVSGFECVGDLLLVHSNNPGKLVWFDVQGRADKEISLSEVGRLEFIFHAGDTSYFFKQGLIEPSRGAVPVAVPHFLLAVFDDAKQKRELTSFPVRTLAVGGAMLWDSIQAAVMDGRFVFVTHSNPYSIKVFDCLARSLLRTFSRPYKRVGRPKDSRPGSITTSDGTRYVMPGSEYLNDVGAMFVAKDKLWIQTSTKDPDKGALFDVFDVDGRYVDMFYLKTGGRLLAVDGDAVFIVERMPDEILNIAKYRILN